MNDFVDYLIKLAPEGETFLVVKQKPQLRDGAQQFHADGALKCTFPSFLPEKMKGEGAWYGNTGSFILDRFVDGRVSASRANCEFVLAMMLDDVGTKSKVPALEPTWKIETSPGNYQWGYAFDLDTQPTKADFSAAIVAIAEAGYTDPGAINPVRNFRLPGSINLKPGKEGFVAVLAEFHPERLFSLRQICEALQVVPAASSSEYKPLRISDDGTDDVLLWLSEHGLLLQRTNAEGWAGVVCPQASHHTDGNPEARYKPAERGFCCYHGHCQDFKATDFLNWVAEQGGPAHTPGLREELLSMTVASALAKIAPTAEFPDESARVVREVENKELGRIDKADFFKRFAYIQSDDSYFDLQDRRELSRGTFNALFRHVTCDSLHNKRRIEAAVYFDENRQACGAKALVGVTYAAGDTVQVARSGLVYGNRWRDARPDVSGAAVSGAVASSPAPWLRHAERLIPEQSEREHVLDVMAFKLQNPAVKINHAVLHAGVQGCGKDTLWAPFIWSVCGPENANRGLVDNDSVSSAWGYHLESEVLILNELREPDANARRALANKLKPIIAAPPDMLSINRKGLHPYDMANRVFVLAFSNDRVPISLESQDRRWFCIYSHAERLDPVEASGLWRWYKSGGFEAVAKWLYARDVSRFNPAAPPAFTEFKANLIEHGMSMAESYLVDLIRQRIGEFASGVVGSPFHALCDRLTGGAPSGVKIPQAALLHSLEEAGWKDMGRLASAEYGTKKNVFAAPQVVAMGLSKSELRRMVEPGAAPGLRMV
jgi:hypothetical protein